MPESLGNVSDMMYTFSIQYSLWLVPENVESIPAHIAEHSV